MRVVRVISGGQIGADVAGLRAAKAAGIPTGGYAPKGFKTKLGDKPELASMYGLRDSGRPYAERTKLNVAHSDGTIRFAAHWNSPGEICTLNAIKQYGKPHFDVRIQDAGGAAHWEEVDAPEWCRLWIEEHQIEVLNIAGNALTWIERLVEEYLANVFK